jgi:hypothetical protein
MNTTLVILSLIIALLVITVIILMVMRSNESYDNKIQPYQLHSFPCCNSQNQKYDFSDSRKKDPKLVVKNDHWVVDKLNSSVKDEGNVFTFLAQDTETRALTMPDMSLFATSVDCMSNDDLALSLIVNSIKSAIKFWKKNGKEVKFIAYHWGKYGSVPWTHMHSTVDGEEKTYWTTQDKDVNPKDSSSYHSTQNFDTRDCIDIGKSGNNPVWCDFKYINENFPCIDWIPCVLSRSMTTSRFGIVVNMEKEIDNILNTSQSELNDCLTIIANKIILAGKQHYSQPKKYCNY